VLLWDKESVDILFGEELSTLVADTADAIALNLLLEICKTEIMVELDKLYDIPKKCNMTTEFPIPSRALPSHK
jgi:hypothetical protein